jgi:hypothetical protein
MPRRYFTPDEANALLAEVKPLAEELVTRRRALAVTTARKARLVSRIAGNGGDFDPQEPRVLEQQLEQEAQGVVQCVERLEGLGVLVKDLDRGLIDFPALRRREEVLLCWQVGEDEVTHWHGLEEGFAGRKRLPFD